MGLVSALLVLSLLIFIHELGHFLAARFFGVKVEVFSIGFGKAIAQKRIGDTLWRLSAVPLGGYVKMKGQDDTDPNAKTNDLDSYGAKAPWQRIVILLAGPFANFALAFLLYMVIALIGVPKLPAIVGKVTPNSPAFEAGIKPNDRIIALNQKPIRFWEEVGESINQTPKEITVTIERNGTKTTLTLSPRTIKDRNIFGETIRRRIIGIMPRTDKQTTLRYTPLQAPIYAAQQTLGAAKLIFLSVQKLISGAIGVENLGGVISIVDITAKATHQGLVALLFFSALISVNLGVLNLLPIPALDGGHIVFNLYEALRGKPPHEAVMFYLTVAGWMILLGVMALGLYNDINRLSG